MSRIKAVMQVLYTYNPRESDEISVQAGQVVYLLSHINSEWFKVQKHRKLEELEAHLPPKAIVGLVPSSYLIPHPAIGPAKALYSCEADGQGKVPLKVDESMVVYFKEQQWDFVGIGPTGTTARRRAKCGFVPSSCVEEGFFEFETAHSVKESLKPSSRIPDPSKVQLWHDISGRFGIKAQLLRLTGGDAFLHKLNGVVIKVPLKKMSKSDRVYIRNQSAATQTTPEFSSTPKKQVFSAEVSLPRRSTNNNSNGEEEATSLASTNDKEATKGEHEPAASIGQAIQRAPLGTPSELDSQIDVARTEAYVEILRRFQGISWPNSSASKYYDKLDLSMVVTYDPWVTARGHFADVHKGSLNDEMVAVKVLRLPTYNPYNKEIYEKTFIRFFREMTFWAELQHINIVRMVGFTVSKGTIALVSLWHEGGNLVDHLATNPDASMPDLMLDVAEGTQYLHDIAHLAHGDLKGMNILINKHGIACLADFGISQQMDDVNRHTGFTTTGSITGTLYWMAPEVIQGERPSYASDIYSCAGVFLEICSRKCPFYYLSMYAVAEPKLRGEIPQRSHYPELNDKDKWWDLFSLCWNAQASKRPTITTIVQVIYGECGLEPRATNSVARRLLKAPIIHDH